MTIVKQSPLRKRKVKAGLRWSRPATGSFTMLLTVFMVFAPTTVSADRFDTQIRRLQDQNTQTRQQDILLENEEADLQTVINRIQTDIAGVEKQIKETRSKQTDTEQSIAENEKTLAEQRDLLGQNIRTMYVEGSMTTLEMLASSNDLSDYVDKKQYRIAIQNKISTALAKVKTLQEKLTQEKQELDGLVADLDAMQSRLDGQRSEHQRLLALNQGQQAAFEKDLSANNTKIAELRRQQIAENSRFTSGGSIPDGTGYPWANVPFPNEISDPWGMYLRQCVSYTAWKVSKSGRRMPYWGGRGNANQWDDNARAAGIPVDSKPRVGDVAISNRGYYGHSMYVEAVYGDGTVLVSQYNAGWDGKYSEARIAIGDLVFIHF